MKTSSFLLLVCLCFIWFLTGCDSSKQSEIDGLKKQVAALNDRLGPLPASLDQYYPPKADQPVFLMKMLGMSHFASSILADFQEKDMANAMADFEKFKAAYKETSELVPEWKEWFLEEPLNTLGDALKEGDPAKVMPAFEGVGNVCHNCHIAHMANVKFKYQWPDFRQFQIPDPFREGDADIKQLMHYLAMGLDGIVSDLEQGQKDAAVNQFHFFNTSFQALKGTCGLCHETDRAYYVDQGMQAMVDQLGEAVSASEVDMAKIMNLTQAIGMENCYKCHLVHIPAALAKDYWSSLSAPH